MKHYNLNWEEAKWLAWLHNSYSGSWHSAVWYWVFGTDDPAIPIYRDYKSTGRSLE